MSVKSDFIEALRQTPDGINGFLSTPIPTLEATSNPTTTDDAIITQGILAHNLNLIFKTMEGLTPIELLLRIGQHSNVAEVIALSGLEYLGSEQGQDFKILEPTDDGSYAPGDIRIVVKGKGNISTVTVNVTSSQAEELGITPIDVTLIPDETSALFIGYARCEQVSEYTFTATAEFNDKEGTTGTVAVTITISDDGDTKVDLTEIDMAAKKVDSEVDGVMHWAYGELKGAVTSVAAGYALSLAWGLFKKAITKGKA